MSSNVEVHSGVKRAGIIKKSVRVYGPWVLILHVLGFGLLVLGAGSSPEFWALGLLAYTLGVRHAFDADHIAAIDGTVRKLLQQRANPLGVGFYFSLGHSSIVVIAAVTIVFVARWLTEHLPGLESWGEVFGTIVSGVFLLLIGLINLFVWISLWRVFTDLRRGTYQSEKLEDLLDQRGLMNRLLKPMWRFVSRSWHVYFIGLLFGLGFDTATQVTLLALTVSGATTLSWLAILSLPILFAAGMVLFDTADGVFMTAAYNWAFSTPLRKIYYNLTITGLTVLIALVIGLFELLQVLANKLSLEGGIWAVINVIDVEWLGYAIIALFALSFLTSYAIWKFGRIEERYGQK